MSVFTLCLYLHASAPSSAALTLAVDGEPAATIVTASEPTPSAALAAAELQLHVRKMTGASLPIVSDEAAVEGTRVLVGHSATTRALGIDPDDLAPQEYMIRFLPDTLALVGRDRDDSANGAAELGYDTYGAPVASYRRQIDYGSATASAPGGELELTLPGLFDDQGTCYATYVFLERFCGVRWYGPSEINIITPERDTLVVEGEDVRRTTSLRHRHATGGGWPIVNAQWDAPTEDQLRLYWRRMRIGGKRWAGNHTIWTKTVAEVFDDPAYQAVGRGAGSQLCLTHPKLVQDMAQAARDFFDGVSLPEGLKAMGDHFGVVPDDNASWCECDNCAEALAVSRQDTRGAGMFSNGASSYYIFQFVNAVAKEVGKSHPDRYISALAYASYAYPPLGLELEPNVSVAPCLQICYGYVPDVFANDADLYRLWLDAGDRPIYLWNYFHHPLEPALIEGWKAFPSFMPEMISQEVKQYARDGVRGVFLCGIGQQLDYYLYMQTAFDADTDAEVTVAEFFDSYFGAASTPMRRFYRRIADINREEGVIGTSREKSWGRLGTPDRMALLEADIHEATDAASTEVERQRVDTWRRGIWDYMQAGYDEYHADAE
ncbi:DUF4838 domain-containing protein [Candidatus Poribacteria bacterium]|jgi:hypothetical protein|nr:DUF4838 domain-containing protein [Candidatus Poribacteria bacterium]MBT5535012.1 DUF4838 domain-containing protein [Candidatus Poribacteria bacterium]MBT5709742.1 DUF4838 domain-containing protein [Candidatus Poribacteria bacterium]MBT7806489.1 DUF4838 domain-containing protein [Candidatus Poribacteria bacterium]